MAEAERTIDDEPEEGERPGGHAARVDGERLRRLAEEEAARAEEEATSTGKRTADASDDVASSSSLVLDTLGVEPVTDTALEALGEPAADFRPCPFCEGYGAVVADDLLARLPGVVEALAPFKQSSVFVRCDECDGWGTVLTGGRTADNGIQPCPKCMSHGYIDTREGRAGSASEPMIRLNVAERERFGLPDPFTTPPPEGEPPAAGMEWDEAERRWAYPARVS